MRATSKLKLALAEWLIGHPLQEQVESIQFQLADLQLRLRAMTAHNARLAALLIEHCTCQRSNTCEVCRAVFPEDLYALDS
jgi:hypothetical protein